MTTTRRTVALALVALAVALTACTTAPKPLEISELEEIDATVIAIDVTNRYLELSDPEGNEIGLRVGPEVRNLSQVEVGDTLRVTYYSGFTVALSEQGAAGTDNLVMADRTAEGERPGAMAGALTRATVTILSIAADGSAVGFHDADGRMQFVDVTRKESQAFAMQLKRGDLIDIVFTEALAISIKASN